MIADVAFIFHWPLSELDAMDPIELVGWRARAIDRWNRLRAGKGD